MPKENSFSAVYIFDAMPNRYTEGFLYCFLTAC